MYLTTLLTLSAAVAGIIAAPYSPFPLPDGFPKPNPAQLAIIEKKAQGTLPNKPLPKIIKSAGVTTLQLLSLNEIFEVAYFTELLANITNNVPGYDAASIAPLDRQYVIDSITAVVNVRIRSFSTEFLLSLTQFIARATPRTRCERSSQELQPHCNRALQIPISTHHIPRSHNPSRDLHRRRSRHSPRSPNPLRHRRRRRDTSRSPFRVSTGAGRRAGRLLPIHSKEDSFRRAIPDWRIARLRFQCAPAVHRSQLVSSALVSHQYSVIQPFERAQQARSEE